MTLSKQRQNGLKGSVEHKTVVPCDDTIQKLNNIFLENLIQYEKLQIANSTDFSPWTPIGASRNFCLHMGLSEGLSEGLAEGWADLFQGLG
jgi:hypothetical protein